MSLVIFSPVCTPCKYKIALNTVKSYAKQHGLAIEIKNTLYSLENKKLAESIGQALPFVYNSESERSTELVGVTHEELERIRGIR